MVRTGRHCAEQNKLNSERIVPHNANMKEK